jgi:hypothetical protein
LAKTAKAKATEQAKAAPVKPVVAPVKQGKKAMRKAA